MKKFFLNLQFLFKPSYYLMNNEYDEIHDKCLNKLLDKYHFVIIDSYHAKLGNVVLWIENRPYASMLIRGLDGRPSRLTIKRAIDKLQESLDIEKTKKISRFMYENDLY